MEIRKNRFRWLILMAFGLLLAACTGGGGEETAAAKSEETAGQPSNGSAAATKPLLPTPTTPVGVDASTVDPSKYDEYEIITLLPPDAIPAINNPSFLSAEEADGYYDPDELVIGVNFDGDARAYSVPHLSTHEIVNDTVGGVKIAVTW